MLQQKQGAMIKEPARIVWVDIAKAIAIIATIIGHTVEYGSNIRNLIFSFHMPLFFVLAGYTFRKAELTQLKAQTIKDFKRLILPVLICRAISFLDSLVLYPEKALFNFRSNLLRVVWGNAFDYGDFLGVGIIWFLIALFYAKFAYRIVLHGIQKCRTMFLLFFCFGAMNIGAMIHLPQCLDLIPIAMLFMEFGYLLKHAVDEDSDRMRILGVVSFFGWVYLTWEKGIYIELAARRYPYSMLSVLIALAACLCVIQLSKALSGIPFAAKPMTFVGRHSLELLCIHHFDGVFIRAQSQNLQNGLVRTAANILILLAFVSAKKMIRSRRERSAAVPEKTGN